MASFWPTPMAAKNMPEVADGMNKSEKIVFSKTLKNATWNNTRIIKNNIVEETKKLKSNSSKNMTILGSGTILTQLAEAGLVDTYMFMLDPLALGDGTPIFKGIGIKLELKLTETRSFKSGRLLLTYEPIKSETLLI